MMASVSGNSTMVSGNTSWRIDWDLKPVNNPGSVVDGTYSLTAQAFDDRGIAGDAKSAQVSVNRTIPNAPTGFSGGHNTRDGDWVDFSWSLAPDRDIIGYRVYWTGPDGVVNNGGGDDVRVCPGPSSPTTLLSNTSTNCQDMSPPSGSTKYYVLAYDYPTPSTGVPRPGLTNSFTVAAATAQPEAPQNPNITGIDKPTLSWDPPAGSVAFYRIYRDGTTPDDRIGTPTGSPYVDGGASPSGHNYWISSVNSSFNESALVALTWSP